jgi:tetratricopeptide (TPR) repeat protein
MPSTDQLLGEAEGAHAAGRLGDAEALVRRVLRSDPANISAHLLLGVLAGKTGRDELAFDHLRLVVEAEPDRIEALFWMSVLYRRKREFAEASRLAEQAVRIRPGDPTLQNNLGLCYLDDSRLDDAVAAFRRATTIRADYAQIHHNLGTALYLLGRDFDAAQAFEQALQLNPQSLDSHLSLGQTMLSLSEPSKAADSARRALAISPKSAPAELLLASALAEDGRADEGDRHVRKAIALNPQDSKAHALLGMRMQSVGRFTEANEHLQKSIELEPRQGFAYFAFVHNNRVTEEDRPMLARMRELVDEGRLPPRELSFLRYGLGRAQEALGEYEQAIGDFDEANRLSRKIKFGDEPFDRRAYAAGYDWLIETFSRDFMARHGASGDSSELPIVIVGMMRSGTTLAEQILSSHPKIGAGGEQQFWRKNSPGILRLGKAGFDPSVLQKVAGNYVNLLQSIAPEASRVTDKMPVNFELLGPIHIGLRNARIIHMRRNPADTCISIYTTPNRIPISYAYDRDNIVFAYEQYERLMEHWRAVLPPDRFLEVRYEDLVYDRDNEARKMIRFLGLEWDDALLHHERTGRTVLTPSVWQVRQPIYTTSIDRWRRFEPWLGAFRKLLPSN